MSNQTAPTPHAGPSAAADLPRTLGVFDATALLVGSVIGSGIFVVPALIAQRIPEPGTVIAVWIFSGLLVLCGALTLAELGAMLPRSGGLYAYMHEAYGPFWAFLYGWTIMLVAIPSSVAALTTAFFTYLQLFVPLEPWVQKALGILVLVGLGYVNTRGAKQGAALQNLFTMLKVSGLILLIGLAIGTGRGDLGHFTPVWPTTWSTGLLSAIGLSMISTLFAYDGWQFVSLVAGEIRDPQRNIPRSIVIGTLSVIAIYVTANLAYYFVLGTTGIASSERVAADAMARMVGPTGATIITLAIVCSTFGAISANVLAGPRVFYAMARDGVFAPFLAKVDPRHGTPANAIWALVVWAGLLTLTGGYEHLITMSSFSNFIFFTMAVCSVVVLRRRHPDWPRPYKVVGYPVTVGIFVVVSALFVLNTLIEAPGSSLLGLGLVAAGVPFYRPKRR